MSEEDGQDKIADKVVRYEHFLNETLRGDLRQILAERDKLYGQLAEYLELKTVIEKIKEDHPAGTPLKTKVDLGCNFYMQANVPDTKYIFVHVGDGFFVEFTLDEALRFIDKKTSHMNTLSDKLTADAAKVKAHIKMVLEGLREIQGIEEQGPPPPQRDIFA